MYVMYHVTRLQREYLMPGGEEMTTLVDLTQTRLQCCGVTSQQDYDNVSTKLLAFAFKHSLSRIEVKFT